MRAATLWAITVGCAALIVLVVVVNSGAEVEEVNEDDDALLRRCEMAIDFMESRVESASSDDEWKALSIDVDYIYEKLDSVLTSHPRDYHRKELRKSLVLRCTALAKVVDSKNEK